MKSVFLIQADVMGSVQLMQDPEISSSLSPQEHILSSYSPGDASIQGVALKAKRISIDNNEEVKVVVHREDIDLTSQKIKENNSWLTKFTKSKCSVVGYDSYQLLKSLLSFYIQNLSKEVSSIDSELCQVSKLRDYTSATLTFFHFYWSGIKNDIADHSLYMDQMSTLIGMYIDLELIVFEKTENSTMKISRKLIAILYLYLDNSKEYMLRALYRSKILANNEEIRELIFSKCFDTCAKNMELKEGVNPNQNLRKEVDDSKVTDDIVLQPSRHCGMGIVNPEKPLPKQRPLERMPKFRNQRRNTSKSKSDDIIFIDLTVSKRKKIQWLRELCRKRKAKSKESLTITDTAGSAEDVNETRQDSLMDEIPENTKNQAVEAVKSPIHPVDETVSAESNNVDEDISEVVIHPSREDYNAKQDRLFISLDPEEMVSMSSQNSLDEDTKALFDDQLLEESIPRERNFFMGLEPCPEDVNSVKGVQKNLENERTVESQVDATSPHGVERNEDPGDPEDAVLVTSDELDFFDLGGRSVPSLEMFHSTEGQLRDRSSTDLIGKSSPSRDPSPGFVLSTLEDQEGSLRVQGLTDPEFPSGSFLEGPLDILSSSLDVNLTNVGFPLSDHPYSRAQTENSRPARKSKAECSWSSRDDAPFCDSQGLNEPFPKRKRDLLWNQRILSLEELGFYCPNEDESLRDISPRLRCDLLGNLEPSSKLSRSSSQGFSPRSRTTAFPLEESSKDLCKGFGLNGDEPSALSRMAAVEFMDVDKAWDLGDTQQELCEALDTEPEVYFDPVPSCPKIATPKSSQRRPGRSSLSGRRAIFAKMVEMVNKDLPLKKRLTYNGLASDKIREESEEGATTSELPRKHSRQTSAFLACEKSLMSAILKSSLPSTRSKTCSMAPKYSDVPSVLRFE
ncbi:uncharacterized protein LOC105699144 isoform X2 [Orussus abietinus]|uniref:uncharacterized protein LOC105699144 isoform X2 n=2 Tax=Orussus abietinus TaxID=222816 RepID=UPI0006260DBC|nr:uncharacterized protein LOC105699144 isoform X2 [Orussus abietinus]